MHRSIRGLGIVASLVAGRAMADDAADGVEAHEAARVDARRAYDRGAKSLDAGDDDGALEAFLEADTLVPSAEALEAGSLAVTRAHPGPSVERFCRRVEERMLDPQSLVKARAACDEKGAAFGSIALTCKAKCAATIDGEALTPGPHAVREGTHTLVVDGTGSTIVVRRHERAARTVSPAEPTRSTTPPPKPRQGLSPAIFFVGVGVTTALGAGTIASGVDAATKHGRFVDDRCALAPSRRTSSAAQCEDLARSGSTASTRTNVLAAVTGGVGLATALVGALGVSWSTRTDRARVSVAPSFVSLDVVF